jgi:PhoH-like ATPase
VVLVSKDINMRIKARALGLPAEDYFNDKTLEDGDLLYTGVLPLPADFWERHGKTMELAAGRHTFYRISGPLVPSLLINQFVYLEAPGAAPLYARSPRSPARPPCCRRCATMPPARTRSGA